MQNRLEGYKGHDVTFYYDSFLESERSV